LDAAKDAAVKLMFEQHVKTSSSKSNTSEASTVSSASGGNKNVQTKAKAADAASAAQTSNYFGFHFNFNFVMFLIVKFFAESGDFFNLSFCMCSYSITFSMSTVFPRTIHCFCWSQCGKNPFYFINYICMK